MTTIEFGKITSSFSLSMSNFWICYGVLCVSWVAIVLCPFSPMELRHKIFNRSHLNLKLRLGPVFFHSSPFLQFAYTIYLKKCLISRGKNTNYIHITLYSYVYVYNFYQQYFLNAFISQNICPPNKALVDLNGSNQMKYTERIMNWDHTHIISWLNLSC